MKNRSVAAVSSIIAGAVGAVGVGKVMERKLKECERLSERNLALFHLMNQWVNVKQQGKELGTYFKEQGYKRIAIYGMSYVGETLYNELKDTDIEVAYAIDRNSNELYSDIRIVSPDEMLEEVDAIVVTAIFYFDEIENALKDRVNSPIISLEDVVYSV